jgi:hypothetical protein
MADHLMTPRRAFWRTVLIVAVLGAIWLIIVSSANSAPVPCSAKVDKPSTALSGGGTVLGTTGTGYCWPAQRYKWTLQIVRGFRPWTTSHGHQGSQIITYRPCRPSKRWSTFYAQLTLRITMSDGSTKRLTSRSGMIMRKCT